MFIEQRILEPFDLGSERSISEIKELVTNKFGFTQSASLSPPGGIFTWNLNASNLNVNDKNKINSFIAAKADGFRFKDCKDYQAVTENLGTVSVTPTILQMRKLYSFGGNQIYKPLYKIVSGTVTIFDDGVASPTGWSLNYNTGVLTITGFTGVVTATFQFDWPVVFENNVLPEVNNLPLLNSYSGIILRELTKI